MFKSGRRILLAAALCLSCVFLGAKTHAGEIPLSDDSFTPHVKSIRELRFKRVIHQQFDFSCGSAATATLLTYSYDRPVSEAEAFKVMYAKGDRASIRKVGFSLLDMQTYFAALGMHSDGYKLKLAQVAKIAIPAITLIKPNGYNHFVVIRGLSDRDVLVADSALGLRRVPIDDFTKIWSGVVFYLKDEPSLGHHHFNDPQDWALTPGAPMGRSFDHERDGIGDLFFDLPLAQQF